MTVAECQDDNPHKASRPDLTPQQAGEITRCIRAYNAAHNRYMKAIESLAAALPERVVFYHEADTDAPVADGQSQIVWTYEVRDGTLQTSVAIIARIPAPTKE